MDNIQKIQQDFAEQMAEEFRNNTGKKIVLETRDGDSYETQEFTVDSISVHLFVEPRRKPVYVNFHEILTVTFEK